MGAIGETVKAYVPITWDALTKDSRYGATMLQGRVERAKYQVLGTASPAEADEEDLTWNVQEFIAKKTLLLIIPAAIEFWLAQPVTKSTTGTQEIVSYGDRVKALQDLYARILGEIAVEEPLIDPPQYKTVGFPKVSDGQSDILITANPHKFLPAFNLDVEETT